MKKIYLTLGFISAIRFATCAQNYNFIPAPDFPIDAMGRDDASVFVIGDSAFVGLGTLADYSLGNDFYVFNEHTNSWNGCAPLPMVGRQYSAAFTLNGKGYLLGGVGANDFRYKDVWVYEPSTNSWSPEQTFPGTKRQGVQTAVMDNWAFCFFGRDSAGYLNEVWKFNGNVWQQTTAFPQVPRYLSTHVQFGDDVYFVCGFDGTDRLSEVWKFNLSTESWSQLADFPGAAHWYGRGFVYEDKIYVGAGWGSTNFLDEFWSYEPISQTWEQINDFPGGARKGMANFTVNDRPFMGMGAQPTGTRDKLFWEFVPNASMSENNGISTVNIFPNPTSNYLNVELPEGENTTYAVVDLQGKTMLSGNFNSNPHGKVDVYDLSNGMYFLLIHVDKTLLKEKFLINR